MLTLKAITPADIDTALSIITQGQKHLKEQGIDQWQNGYPDKERLIQDEHEHIGYLLLNDGQPAGYICIVLTGEPAYDKIDGQWLTNGKYAAIHRIVLSDAFRGQGLSSAVFSLADDCCRSHGILALRIDTHADNHKMQHVLSKNGYTFCGIVEYPSGLRRAYEKCL